MFYPLLCIIGVLIGSSDVRVEYSIDDFLDSSRDRVSDDIQQLLQACSMACMVKSPHEGDRGAGSGARGGPRVQTLGKKFKLQLEGLMSTLDDTEPHYIKCIKPNSLKVPNCFHGTTSYNQLKASGIFEAVDIRSRGYNIRYSHAEFLKQYGPLVGLNGLGKSNNLKARCDTVVHSIAKIMGWEGTSVGLHVGKTRVFSMYQPNKALVQMLATRRHNAVLKMQCVCVGFVARIRYALYKQAVPIAISALSLQEYRDSLPQIDAALSALHKYQYQYYQMLCEKKERIVERQRVEDELELLQHVSLRDIDGKWLAAVKKARQFAITGPTAQKMFEMLKSYELKVACDTRHQRLVSSDCCDVALLESALEEIDELKPQLGADVFREDEQVLRLMLQAARQGQTIDLTAHQRRHQEQQGARQSMSWQSVGLPAADEEPVAGDEASCPCCKEIFQRSPPARAPKFLNCLHWFCGSCLHKIYSEMLGGVKCPSCELFTKCGVLGVNSLKTNFTIMAKLPPNCNNCDVEVALFECVHCPTDCRRLCRSCANTHQQLKAFRHHNVRSVTSPLASVEAGVCAVHPNRHLDAFCCDCRQVVCLSCAVFQHSNHSIIPTEQAVDREKVVTTHHLAGVQTDVSLLKQMDSDLEKTQPSLDEQRRIMREVVAVVFTGLRKLIKSRHADLLSSLEVLYGQKRKALVDTIDELSFQIDCLQSAASTSGQLIEESDDARLLEIIPTVQQHLQSLLQAPLKINHALDAELAFTAGPELEVKRLMECVGLCRGTAACADAFQCSVEVIQSGVFTGSWRVMLLLTARNMNGVRLERGGLPVTFEVVNGIMSTAPCGTGSRVSSDGDMVALSSIAAGPDRVKSPLTVDAPASSTVSIGVNSGDAILSTGGRRLTNYVPAAQRTCTERNTMPNSPTAPVEKRQRPVPAPAVTSPYITSVADNNDGTYFLLVSPREPSQSCGEVSFAVKIFGQHVRGSPVTLDLDSLARDGLGQYDANSESDDDIPMGVCTSSSTDNVSVLSTDTRSVESFFKYITGGFL